jgi:DNA processing protein
LIAPDELAAWLRLTLTPGVGNSTARKLLAAFGMPQAIFSQTQAALRQVVSTAQASALLAEPPGWLPLCATTEEWLRTPQATGCERAVLTIGDAHYPRSLLEIEDPPLMLYVLGRGAAQLGEASGRAWLHDITANIALVGSRNPTPQGAFNAREFAKALRSAGLTVVSGLALGVDGAAHEGALDMVDDVSEVCAPLATVAVVGTGLDRVYPKKHLALARRIAQHGAILSEFPLGTPALSENFPKRNRIISGLAQGTLVVEAALRSGSLITARMAIEQGRDVFAIPGSIHAAQSRGCHALIKQGAKLVESAQDVLEELRWPATQSQSTDAPLARNGVNDHVRVASMESGLLTQLGYDPVGLDALVARTGLAAAELQVRLLELELDGALARLPGGLFQRVGSV